MTDNEIIKALECCHTTGCYDCPCYDFKIDECRGFDHTDLLNLINCQNAEIERLKEELDGETVKNMRLGHEIERLKAESQMADGYADALVERTKSEAYKEFADGLVTMFLNINESLNCEDIVENIKRFSSRLTEGRENV